MFKDEVLENDKRRKIYEIIEKNPGIHLRELQRILQMPVATIEYHLGYMTRRRIIYNEADEHLKRYYTQPLNSEDKKLLSALRQKKLREIVLVILSSQKAKYQFLADCFKLPHSTLSLYLKYLVDRGVLDREKVGYENIYTVHDEDRVARVLVSYKSSFMDTLVDRTLATWMETRDREKVGIRVQS
jgi:predicted transcriptional regulator